MYWATVSNAKKKGWPWDVAWFSISTQSAVTCQSNLPLKGGQSSFRIRKFQFYTVVCSLQHMHARTHARTHARPQ